MTAAPGPFRDQHGNPLSQADLFERLSEAILANVIACEEAGIPPEHITMVVGQDGGTVVADGKLLQTPVTARLSEAQGRQLFAVFEALLGDYRAQRLPVTRLAQIRAAYNVEHKREALRRARPQS